MRVKLATADDKTFSWMPGAPGAISSAAQRAGRHFLPSATQSAIEDMIAPPEQLFQKYYPRMAGWSGEAKEFWNKTGMDPQKLFKQLPKSMSERIRQARSQAIGQKAFNMASGDSSSSGVEAPEALKGIRKLWLGQGGVPQGDWTPEQLQKFQILHQKAVPQITQAWESPLGKGLRQAGTQLTGPGGQAVPMMTDMARQYLTQTDKGWQWDEAGFRQDFANLEKGLTQAGYDDPTKIADILSGTRKTLGPVQENIKDQLKNPSVMVNQFRTGDRVDPQKVKQFFGDVVPGIQNMSEYLDSMGLNSSNVIKTLGSYGQTNLEKYKTEEDTYDFALIAKDVQFGEDVTDALVELKDDGSFDPKGLMELKNSVLPGAMKGLAKGDESMLDTLKNRYTKDGKFLKNKFQTEVKGFNVIQDELKNVFTLQKDVFNEKEQKKFTEQGFGSLKDLINMYSQDGKIDFEAAEGDLKFWEKALPMLKENPKLKKRFIQSTNFFKKVSGIGFLKKGTSLLAGKFDDLFLDEDGNLREDRFKTAIRVGSWGNHLYKRLIEEKDPLAWLGVVGVAVGAIGLIRGIFKLFGGGGKEEEPQRRQVVPGPAQPQGSGAAQQGGPVPSAYMGMINDQFRPLTEADWRAALSRR